MYINSLIMRLSLKLFKVRIERQKIVSLVFCLAIMNYNQILKMIIDRFSYWTLELDIQMIIWA